ncbi:MAG: Eco57I restriction-modification methylase domain-containing protein [bacterium]|nr:Eco57I restriction-modification methylase domain-containing protein [bacterium]
MTDGLQVATPAASSELAVRTEARRAAETADRSAAQRSALGQFFTPAPIASLLAGMFDPPAGPTRVLDPGAGVGSLTAALVDRAMVAGWAVGLDVTAVEVDRDLLGALTATLHECTQVSSSVTARAVSADFVEWACQRLDGGLFAPPHRGFDLAILNPPYQKLATSSAVRRMLSGVGIEVTNLYAAFVALALALLNPGGQLVAITPRSFCNGPYFRAFRRELIESSALRRIHLFEARDKAFRDTGVLQENVVVHLVKGAPQAAVTISTSPGSGEEDVHEERVPFAHVVRPDDPDAFIRIISGDPAVAVATRMAGLECSLSGAGAAVSTGRVVDFRVREHLRESVDHGTVPLLYPHHLRAGRVQLEGPRRKKPAAIAVNRTTQKMLLPAGNYVLVKRFSSKEERRRVVAAVLEIDALGSAEVAVENHVNVFHRDGTGLPLDLAWGIAAYLNTTAVDVFFRQFNGHTQVNATDLRSLNYPTMGQLETLGAAARETEHTQAAIDALFDRYVPAAARWPQVVGDRLDTTQVARLLGVSRQALAKRQHTGSLLGFGKRTQAGASRSQVVGVMPWARSSTLRTFSVGVLGRLSTTST